VSDRLDAIRAVYERYAEGDFAVSLPLLDPSIALVVTTDIPDGGNFFGHAGVREYMTRFLEPWESVTLAAVSIEERDNVIVARVRQDAVGRGSGAAATLEYFQLWTFRGEKVVHLEVTFRASRGGGSS
jgi:ketosteroid isomerase-like protein